MNYQKPLHLLTSSVLLAFAVIGLLLALAACGGDPAADSSAADTNTESAATTATPGDAAAAPTTEIPPTVTTEPGGGNLTIGIPQDVEQLRPWQPRNRSEEQVITMLYSGLVTLDSAMRPQPDLAERWESTADGRVITFTLRPDLRWHDGETLDGTDVLFTLEQLRSLPITSTALLANLRYISGIGVPQANTVVLTLTERYAPLISELALPVLPQHLLQDRDLASTNFWELPIGSGPFRLVNRTPGQAIILERNTDYHRGAPLLDSATFVVTPDPQLAVEALQAGNLLLAEVPWQNAAALAETPTLTVSDYPENGFYFVGFNLRDGRPFADPQLRQALAVALDVPRIVEAATGGQGQVIASSALPGSWADLTAPPDRAASLEGARNLLNEAGWTLPEGSTVRQRDGQPFAATLVVRGDDPRRVQAAEAIADTAGSIGLPITVEAVEFESGLLPRYAPPFEFDAVLGSWLNGAGDPSFGDSMYYDPDDFNLFHSSQIVQSESDTRTTRNFVAFNDPEYDEAAEKVRQLYDPDERAESVVIAQGRVAELLPYLYLWVDRLPVVLNDSVTTTDGPVDLASPRYLWNVERWYVQ